jgi:hypothetical protein
MNPRSIRRKNEPNMSEAIRSPGIFGGFEVVSGRDGTFGVLFGVGSVIKVVEDWVYVVDVNVDVDVGKIDKVIGDSEFVEIGIGREGMCCIFVGIASTAVVVNGRLFW